VKSFDIVIVGGGPAGVSTAISAHNTYRSKSIAVIRKESVALIPCGIPYTQYSLSEVSDDILPDLLVTEKAGAELIIGELVDKTDNILTLADGQKIQYQKLVLAMGAMPCMPSLHGTEKQGVFIIKKDIKYLEKMKHYRDNASKIVIIGGGYIGVELAEEYTKANKEVTLIELEHQLLPNAMDEAFGAKMASLLEGIGVSLIFGHAVTSIEGGKMVQAVQLDDGRRIETDMVVICIGCRPDITLAEKFGLSCDPRYGIHVDEYLRSSEDDIFVVGDITAKRDFFTGKPTDIRLASTAMAEGRLVGSNLFEVKVIRKYLGVMGSFSTKICGVSFGVSGLTEARAKEIKINYRVGEATTVDRHPGCFKDASQTHLKLIFSRYSHVLLGAELYGGDSVGEMVNMLSVMILNKMTDMDIDTLQIGTHPLLTASPIAYPIITATVEAIGKWYREDAA